MCMSPFIIRVVFECKLSNPTEIQESLENFSVMSDVCSIFKEPPPWRWWYVKCTSISIHFISLRHHIIMNIIESVICNVDKIVITELRIGLLCHDLTLV